MNLKFSVLMSVYFKEQPEYLDLSLKSIIDDQILKPNEIVLVKDGPLTKELDEVIDKYILKYSNLFKIISLGENRGLGKALNIGLQHCTYDLVARMDTDDISKPERFKEQIEVFKKNSKLDVVGSWIEEFEIIHNNLVSKMIRKVPQYKYQIYKALKNVCALNHVTVMFKKSIVLKVGSYNNNFKLEDYYLWIRLAINNAEMYNIPKSLVLVRMDREAIARRGGINLLKSDIRFQQELYSLKFITGLERIVNIIKYCVYRMIPGRMRRMLQEKFYRESR